MIDIEIDFERVRDTISDAIFGFAAKVYDAVDEVLDRVESVYDQLPAAD